MVMADTISCIKILLKQKHKNLGASLMQISSTLRYLGCKAPKIYHSLNINSPAPIRFRCSRLTLEAVQHEQRTQYELVRTHVGNPHYERER